MSKHYRWDHQPRWPTVLVMLVAAELGLVMVLAIALAVHSL